MGETGPYVEIAREGSEHRGKGADFNLWMLQSERRRLCL